jgi:hypothetical protein
MTLETLTLILLVAGLIPWHISRRTVGRRPNLATRWQVYALFWRLTIPLIQRLSDAIWAALRRLVE